MFARSFLKKKKMYFISTVSPFLYTSGYKSVSGTGILMVLSVPILVQFFFKKKKRVPITIPVLLIINQGFRLMPVIKKR